MTVPCESHPLYLTDISSWDGRSVRRNIGMCMRQIFPGLTQIRNYRFGIFNFDTELEWCKFRALTVKQSPLYYSHKRSAH